MDTFQYLQKKYNIQNLYAEEMPYEIANVGRDDLAKWTYELGFTLGVEVGVAGGEYSEIIVKANPIMVLHGVDPWMPYREYKDYTKNSTFEGLYAQAIKRLTPYRNYVFMRAFSHEVVSTFENESIDFVYIDANHQYKYVYQDISLWLPKIRVGGIIAGHDYARIKGRTDTGVKTANWAVIEAVNDYMSNKRLRPWFVLGSRAKIYGEVRDDVRSWMYIK